MITSLCEIKKLNLIDKETQPSPVQSGRLQGMNEKVAINIYTVIDIQQTIFKDLLYSTQHSVITYMGRESK